MSYKNRIVGHGEEAPDQLAANPRNWRIHPKGQEDALAGVLDEVGWVGTVLVNQRTGFVVDGHLRVAHAISRNEPTVPVTYVDLSEDEEALVLATFDPLSAMAGRDQQQLDVLMANLRDAGKDHLAQLLDMQEITPAIAPDDFPEYDESISTEHECPKCGYRWSGGVVSE
jgi:hypothetical protein